MSRAGSPGDGASVGPTSGPGHRLVPHTADLILEAWAPTRSQCLEQAVEALVSSFASPAVGAVTRSVPIDLAAADDAELLLLLLGEVIYLAEVRGQVPVAAELDVDGTELRGRFEVISVDQIEQVGAIPKAVSRHALELTEDAETWRCRAVVDV
jgi:SHS2 domain-containing protein